MFDVYYGSYSATNDIYTHLIYEIHIRIHYILSEFFPACLPTRRLSCVYVYNLQFHIAQTFQKALSQI